MFNETGPLIPSSIQYLLRVFILYFASLKLYGILTTWSEYEKTRVSLRTKNDRILLMIRNLPYHGYVMLQWAIIQRFLEVYF